MSELRKGKEGSKNAKGSANLKDQTTNIGTRQVNESNEVVEEHKTTEKNSEQNFIPISTSSMKSNKKEGEQPLETIVNEILKISSKCITSSLVGEKSIISLESSNQVRISENKEVQLTEEIYALTPLLGEYKNKDFSRVPLKLSKNRNIFRIIPIGEPSFIFKQIFYSSFNYEDIKSINRECYIANTLGCLTENVAKVLRKEQTRTSDGKIVVEMKIEDGGESLLNIYNQTNNWLNIYDKIRIAFQLALLLEAMEKIGISHMDIKPENIVINQRTGLFKLIDFGSAVAFNRNPHNIRSEMSKYHGRFKEFTKCYAAPEVLELAKIRDKLKSNEIRKGLIPQKIDSFCFGLTIFDIFTNMQSRKFDRSHTKESTEELIDDITKEKLRLLQLGKWVKLISKCLSYDKNMRPSFSEIVTKIKKILISNNNPEIRELVNLNKSSSINDLTFYDMAKSLINTYDYEPAKWLLLDYLEILEKNNLKLIDSVDKNNAKLAIADVKKELGINCKKLKESISAKKYLNDAISLYNEMSNSREVMALYAHLGDVHLELLELESAENNYKLSLNLVKELKCEKTKMTAEIYENLAKLNYYLDKYSLCKEFLYCSKKILEEINLTDTYDYAKVLCSVAVLITHTDLELSNKYADTARSIIAKNYGNDNLQFITIINQICKIKNSVRDIKFCIKNYKYCINILEPKVSEDCLVFALLRNNLAGVYYRAQKYKKAIANLKDAIVKWEDQYKTEYYLLAAAYNNLALSYAENEEFDKAKEYAEKTIEIVKCKFPGIIYIARAYNTMGHIFQLEEKYTEAIKWYLAAIKVKNEKTEYDKEDKLYVATFESNIALCYSHIGDYKSSLFYCSSSINYYKEIGFSKRPPTATCYQIYASIYEKQAKYDEALKYHNKALKIFEKRAYITEIASAQNNIATIYCHNNEFEKAVELLEKSESVLKKILEDHSTSKLRLYKNMFYAYSGVGNNTKIAYCRAWINKCQYAKYCQQFGPNESIKFNKNLIQLDFKVNLKAQFPMVTSNTVCVLVNRENTL